MIDIDIIAPWTLDMLPSTLNPLHLATLSSVLCLILFLTKKHNQSFMIVLHAVRTYE